MRSHFSVIDAAIDVQEALVSIIFRQIGFVTETKNIFLNSGLKRHLATHLNSLPNANQPQQQHQPTSNEIVPHTQPTGSVPIQTVSEEHKFNNHISLPTTPLPSVSLPLHLTQPQQQQHRPTSNEIVPHTRPTG